MMMAFLPPISQITFLIWVWPGWTTGGPLDDAQADLQ